MNFKIAGLALKCLGIGRQKRHCSFFRAAAAHGRYRCAGTWWCDCVCVSASLDKPRRSRHQWWTHAQAAAEYGRGIVSKCPHQDLNLGCRGHNATSEPLDDVVHGGHGISANTFRRRHTHHVEAPPALCAVWAMYPPDDMDMSCQWALDWLTSVHQLGIDPGPHLWKRCTLPLDH